MTNQQIAANIFNWMEIRAEDCDILEDEDCLHFKFIREIKFPQPKNININMMPFVVDPTFSTLPAVRHVQIRLVLSLIDSDSCQRNTSNMSQ